MQALQVAMQRHDLTGWTVVLRNNCKRPLTSLRMGTSRLRILEIRPTRVLPWPEISAANCCFTRPWEPARGRKDRQPLQSRCQRDPGPYNPNRLASAVSSVTDDVKWCILVDLFASIANIPIMPCSVTTLFWLRLKSASLPRRPPPCSI